MATNVQLFGKMATVASAAAGTAGYVWEGPGDSVMLQVSLDLGERLSAAVQQGLGAGPRGNEIGGILLGRTLPGFGRAVLIEDFELAPCEHLRGVSYTLSPKDKRQLGTRLARRSAREGVGYFRSHTRPGMYLDQDDFAVFSRYFPEAWQVFLLVRPSTEGPAMGGFFFWEDGDINRRSPYRQFPFDCARLADYRRAACRRSGSASCARAGSETRGARAAQAATAPLGGGARHRGPVSHSGPLCVGK